MQYRPPADLNDLKDRSAASQKDFFEKWHTFIADEFAANIVGLKDPRDNNNQLFDMPVEEPLFFSEVDSPATSPDLPITWNAFPLSLMRDANNDARKAWEAAEVLDETRPSRPARKQDEYCEWHVYKDENTQKITRIVFTSEGPEYWVQLALHDFDRVVELYQKYVSPKVKADDLKLQAAGNFFGIQLKKGDYNPYNRWNTRDGVMHLTHRANTLGAEINLAARATIPRKSGAGARITEVRRFACSSNFGDANRSSDPNIGLAANLTALPQGGGASSVTLANPVALYMSKLLDGKITDDQGNPLDWFRFERGEKGHGLMAILEPPPGSPFGFEKVLVAGVPLKFGGQIAEHIEMVLYAKTANLGKPETPLAPVVGCCCVPQGTPPNTIGKLNLDKVDRPVTCAQVNLTEAFQECAPVAGPPNAIAAAMTKLAPSPKGRSRRADE
jgi:hypothetical protein